MCVCVCVRAGVHMCARTCDTHDLIEGLGGVRLGDAEHLLLPEGREERVVRPDRCEMPLRQLPLGQVDKPLEQLLTLLPVDHLLLRGNRAYHLRRALRTHNAFPRRGTKALGGFLLAAAPQSPGSGG